MRNNCSRFGAILKNEVILDDCMHYMAGLPDKAFDLAIVDPPYGSAGGGVNWENHPRSRFGGLFDRYKLSRTGETLATKYQKDGKSIKHWDIAPDDEYFAELFRISCHQIIWGGNYFKLPPNRNFIIWKKLTISETFTMAMAEYAWTSLPGNAKIFECAPQGTVNEMRFHPTQKPIALYKWLLNKYAKPGQTIFDSHIGSGSSRIAAYDLGFDFSGTELDADYYAAQEKRYQTHIAQGRLFEPDEIRQKEPEKGLFD